MRGQLLGFVAAELSKKGSDVISVANLGALALVDEVLDHFPEIGPEAADAAVLAAILPTAENEAVAAALGQTSAALFAQLTERARGDRTIVVHEACRILSEAISANQERQVTSEVVCAAALLAAESGTRGTQRELWDLRQMIELTQLKALPELVRKILQALIDKLPLTEPPHEGEAKLPSWVISISIDVASSTNGKTRMAAMRREKSRIRKFRRLACN